MPPTSEHNVQSGEVPPYNHNFCVEKDLHGSTNQCLLASNRFLKQGGSCVRTFGDKNDLNYQQSAKTPERLANFERFLDLCKSSEFGVSEF